MLSEHKIPVMGGALGSVRVSSGAGATPLVYVNGGPGGTYLDEKHAITALASERDVVLYWAKIREAKCGHLLALPVLFEPAPRVPRNGQVDDEKPRNRRLSDCERLTELRHHCPLDA